MASRPWSPTSSKAFSPRGVVSLIGRSFCSYMSSPPIQSRRTLPYRLNSNPSRDRKGAVYLVIDKYAVVADGHMNRRQLLPLRQASQNLARNLRQQCVGQNVVYIASAALDFSASLRHLVDQRFVVSECDAVRLLNAPLNLSQLETDNQLQRLV